MAIGIQETRRSLSIVLVITINRFSTARRVKIWDNTAADKQEKCVLKTVWALMESDAKGFWGFLGNQSYSVVDHEQLIIPNEPKSVQVKVLPGCVKHCKISTPATLQIHGNAHL